MICIQIEVNALFDFPQTSLRVAGRLQQVVGTHYRWFWVNATGWPLSDRRSLRIEACGRLEEGGWPL
jgi:hypothetical protein